MREAGLGQELDARTKALAALVALLAADADEAEGESLRDRFAAAEPGAQACMGEHLGHLADDAERGREAAFQQLGPVKGDAAAGSGVVERALGLAGGMGKLSPAATATLRQACEALNLSPTRFGL